MYLSFFIKKRLKDAAHTGVRRDSTCIFASWTSECSSSYEGRSVKLLLVLASTVTPRHGRIQKFGLLFDEGEGYALGLFHLTFSTDCWIAAGPRQHSNSCFRFPPDLLSYFIFWRHCEAVSSSLALPAAKVFHHGLKYN
jgi:hypothetical protein